MLSRQISQHRPTILLLVIVLLCLISLGAGVRTAFLREGIRTGTSVLTFPFKKVMYWTEEGATRAREFVTAYGTVRAERDALRMKLTESLSEIAHQEELAAQNKRLAQLAAFRSTHPQVSLVAASVISRSTGTLTYTVDLGSRHGLKEGMCAVTPDGFAGVVTRVEPFESVVMTLRHADCKVGVMIQRNRVRATAHGARNDLSSHFALQYIDPKDDVAVGDVIVTSPDSIFPVGFGLGKVTRVYETGSLWKRAEVDPYVDVQSLDEVFIVLRATAPVEHLTGMIEEEDLAIGHELPDTRTLQERYAP